MIRSSETCTMPEKAIGDAETKRGSFLNIQTIHLINPLTHCIYGQLAFVIIIYMQTSTSSTRIMTLTYNCISYCINNLITIFKSSVISICVSRLTSWATREENHPVTLILCCDEILWDKATESILRKSPCEHMGVLHQVIRCLVAALWRQ